MNIRLVSGIALLLLTGLVPFTAAAPGETIVVTAEGLADPSAATYKKDKGLLLDALRDDARKQIIEKAVGAFVESATLVENYRMIDDRVLKRSKGLIKRIIKESDPWLGQDGFMHLLMKAEVYLSDIRSTLKEMSRTERVHLLKEAGNPKISTNIHIAYLEDQRLEIRHSSIADNILKEKIKAFGYRIWNPEEADFSIMGDIKIQKVDLKLSNSQLMLTKRKINSWSIRCVDTATGEELYFNNQVPDSRGWENEDQAIREIGYLMAGEFSRDFFEQLMVSPSSIFQLQVSGLPDYQTALLLKKEMMGLRPILNIDLRSFERNGQSLYEIEFSGKRANFLQILEKAVIEPINMKLGKPILFIISAQGETIQIAFESEGQMNKIIGRLEGGPPSSLLQAHSQRIKNIISSPVLEKKVNAMRAYRSEKLQTHKTNKEYKAIEAF